MVNNHLCFEDSQLLRFQGQEVRLFTHITPQKTWTVTSVFILIIRLLSESHFPKPDFLFQYQNAHCTSHCISSEYLSHFYCYYVHIFCYLSGCQIEINTINYEWISELKFVPLCYTLTLTTQITTHVMFKHNYVHYDSYMFLS